MVLHHLPARPRRRHGHHRARGRDPRRHARGVRGEGAPERLLRRRGDRGHRRQRGRARRRRRRRLPRQDQARRRDRSRVGRAGRGLPHPCGRASLVADRAARPLVPAGGDLRARRCDGVHGADPRERPLEQRRRASPSSAPTGSSRSRSSSSATADLASLGRSASPERPSQREDDEPDTRENERYRDDDSEERGALREKRRVESG